MSELVTLAEISAFDPTRTNLLLYSRQFDQAAVWVPQGTVTVTANAIAGADNVLAADRLRDAITNSLYALEQTVTVPAANVVHTFSVYAKATSPYPRDLRLTLTSPASAGTGFRGDFDLQAGVAATVVPIGGPSVIASGIQPLGNGWFRCWIQGLPGGTVGTSLVVRLSLISGGTDTYVGNGPAQASGVYLDRALLEAGSVLGDPIETTAAAAAGIKALRYSSAKYSTGATASPPHVTFDRRILSAPNFIRRAFGNARITSGGQATGGVLDLANQDAGLVGLLDLGLDGRDIVVLVGTVDQVYPAGWTTWLKGTIEQPEIGVAKATLRLRDRMAILDLPLQANKYAGTNSGTPVVGAEGVATDLQGQVKPKAWGRCYHVPALLVGSGKLTYQVHDGQVQAIDAVYDRGVSLTAGADYASLALLEAAAVAASTFATCKALGLFRLGAAPAGRVTADVRGDAAGSYVDRPGAIVRRILETVCGVATADIDTASFSALDAAANYECGIWVGADVTRRAVVEAFQATVGGWFLPSRTGVWKAGRLVAPSGTSVATLTDDELLSVERVATGDPDKGVPVGEVTLRWKRYFTAFGPADVAAGVTDAVRGELLQEWRSVNASNAATKALHLLAPKLSVDTLIVSAADAATERDRRLALHSVRRDFVKAQVGLTTAIAALEIGDVVTVVNRNLGYAAGRQMVVLGLGLEGSAVDLELWG